MYVFEKSNSIDNHSLAFFVKKEKNKIVKHYVIWNVRGYKTKVMEWGTYNSMAITLKTFKMSTKKSKINFREIGNLNRTVTLAETGMLI